MKAKLRNTRTARITCFALGALFAGQSLGCSKDAPKTEGRPPSPDGAVVASERRGNSTSSAQIEDGIADMLITHLGTSISQAIYVRRSLDSEDADLGDRIVVEWKEQPVFGSWFVHEREFSVAGQVVGLSSRFYNDFLLAVRSDGIVTFERWVLTDPNGAISLTLATAPSNSGSVVTPAAAEVIVGGIWKPPAERIADWIPERRGTLKKFSGIQSVHGLGVDPDGRYFLVALDGELRQYQLKANPTLLYSVDLTTLGLGASELFLDEFQALDVPSMGRVMYAKLPYGDIDLALVDFENDGVIDGELPTPSPSQGELDGLADPQMVSGATRRFE